MARPTKTIVKRQSPKGLVKVYSEPGEPFDLMTQQGMNDFLNPDRNPMMKFDQSIADGSVVRFGPDFLKMVSNNLTFFEAVARAEGGIENYRLRDIEFGPSLASQMLQNIFNIQECITSIANTSEVESIKSNAYRAIFEATALAANYHCWTENAHEVSIVAHQESREGAIKGAAQKARNLESRDRAMAEAYLAKLHNKRDQRRGKGLKIDTAAATEIGKAQKKPIAKQASIDAIRKGLLLLKKKSGDGGKPEK